MAKGLSNSSKITMRFKNEFGSIWLLVIPLNAGLKDTIIVYSYSGIYELALIEVPSLKYK